MLVGEAVSERGTRLWRPTSQPLSASAPAARSRTAFANACKMMSLIGAAPDVISRDVKFEAFVSGSVDWMSKTFDWVAEEIRRTLKVPAGALFKSSASTDEIYNLPFPKSR